MNNSSLNMPELSSITTEIDVDSLSAACSSLDSSIASFNFNSGSFKSKFSSLNSNGVGVTCVNSIAESVEKISSLVVAISGFLKTNLSNQQSVDESLSSQASESIALNNIPNDQNYLGNKNTPTSNSSGDGSYNVGSSTHHSGSNSNKDMDLNVNENKITNKSELIDKFINELSINLVNVAKNDNKTVASILNDSEYNSIINQLISNIASANSLSIDDINEIGLEVIKKQLLSMTGEGVVSSFSTNLVNNYITNIANLNNISNADVIKKYSNYFFELGSEISSVANVSNTLLNVYDGNSIEKISNDTVSFIRGVVDVAANEQNVSSEQLLSDASSSEYINDRLKEISSILKILR